MLQVADAGPQYNSITVQSAAHLTGYWCVPPSSAIACINIVASCSLAHGGYVLSMRYATFVTIRCAVRIPALRHASFERHGMRTFAQCLWGDRAECR